MGLGQEGFGLAHRDASAGPGGVFVVFSFRGLNQKDGGGCG